MAQSLTFIAQRIKTLLHDGIRLCATNGFLWIIICFGVLLRIVQYLFNRSLWVDESFIALNIINRSYAELAQPLDFTQVAPLGFLMLERFAVQALGDSEFTLRLFPFIFGISSLFLFFQVAKQYTEKNAVPIALGLFVISGPLIYYSSEVKQYSGDVAIALLIYLLTIFFQSAKLTLWRVGIFGLLGSITIWFSHPSIFVLAGVGISLTYACFLEKNWQRIGKLFIVFSFWALNFISSFFLAVRNQGTIDVQEYIWTSWGSFMPFPPLSAQEFKWFLEKFISIFHYPVGIYQGGIAAFVFLIGCMTLFKKNRERFFILILPVLLCLIASGFHKYPFDDRAILFLVPSLILLVAEGISAIINRTKDNSSIMIAALLLVFLFFQPLLSATYHMIKPPNMQKPYEEIKPVLSYLKAHMREGDTLYLYYGSLPAFSYYASKYDFNVTKSFATISSHKYLVINFDNCCITGIKARDRWENYVHDLNKLSGKERVWILFSHVSAEHGVDEEKFFVFYLDRMGEKLDSFKSFGASVYLYDLSKGL